jgi:SAM-dependent methyltransferase
MSADTVKENVRQFYDRVGWQVVSDGNYQNARYEDLRPVAREYIHCCHQRVKRHLAPSGKYLLDAGSGPIQYTEYLTYSEDYAYRVCLDISITGLQEARKRIGDHGLFVVADAANMPFRRDAFGGVVSLHTLHHLPSADQASAYREICRTLQTGKTAVVVNGWTDSALMGSLNWLVSLMEWVGRQAGRLRGRIPEKAGVIDTGAAKTCVKAQSPTGTYIQKLDPAWLRKTLTGLAGVEILVWRSVNVRFLRAVFHDALGGRMWLKLLFFLEEKYPHYFGEKGQYPLVVVSKRGD